MNTQAYNYDKFSEWLRLKKYSSKSIGKIKRVTHQFLTWAAEEGITEAEEITYSDVLLYVKHCGKKGIAQKTTAHYLNDIRKYYSFLMSEGKVQQNPVAFVKVQGVKRRVLHEILSPEELHQLYQQYPVTIEYEAGKTIPPQQKNLLSRKRNKVILGLLIYQGLRVEEVPAIRLQDVQLREGKITIHSQRRTAARVLALESHQLYELMDYLYETRKAFLAKGDTDKLFIQHNRSDNFYSVTSVMLLHLRKINRRVKNFDQVRASVITHWLKQYDLRKVQYMAGHRYVSSTESYRVNVMDELQGDVAKFHPL